MSITVDDINSALRDLPPGRDKFRDIEELISAYNESSDIHRHRMDVVRDTEKFVVYMTYDTGTNRIARVFAVDKETGSGTRLKSDSELSRLWMSRGDVIAAAPKVRESIYLYHSTPSHNLESILRRGLIPMSTSSGLGPGKQRVVWFNDTGLDISSLKEDSAIQFRVLVDDLDSDRLEAYGGGILYTKAVPPDVLEYLGPPNYEEWQSLV